MRRLKKPTVVLYVRIDPDIKERLEKLADNEERSMGYVLKRLLEISGIPEHFLRNS